MFVTILNGTLFMSGPCYAESLSANLKGQWQNTERQCHELQRVAKTLISESPFGENSLAYVHHESLNRHVFSSFMTMLNQAKFIFNQERIDSFHELSALIDRAAGQFFRPHPHTSPCEFVTKFYGYFLSQVEEITPIIESLIDEDPDFHLDDQFTVNLSHFHPQTEEQMMQYWSQRIKLEKLISIDINTPHPEMALTSEALKQSLKQRYQTFFQLLKHPKYWLYKWSKALFSSLDPISYPHIDFNYFHKEFVHIPHFKNPLLSRLMIPDYVRSLRSSTLFPFDQSPTLSTSYSFLTDPPQIPSSFTYMKFQHSYPQKFVRPFIRAKSHLIHAEERSTHNHRNSLSPAPKGLVRRSHHQKSYTFTILHRDSDKFKIRKISTPPGVELIKPFIHMYTFKIKNTHSGGVHKTTVIHMRDLKQNSSDQIHKLHLIQLLNSHRHRFHKHSDMIILDIRNTDLSSVKMFQFVPFVAGLFGSHLPVYHLNHFSEPAKTQLIHSMDLSAEPAINTLAQKPMVILINHRTNIYLSMMAYAMKTMNRALVIGADKLSIIPDQVPSIRIKKFSNHPDHSIPNRTRLLSGIKMSSGWITQSPAGFSSDHSFIRYPFHIHLGHQDLYPPPPPHKEHMPWIKSSTSSHSSIIEYPDLKMLNDSMIQNLAQIFFDSSAAKTISKQTQKLDVLPLNIRLDDYLSGLKKSASHQRNLNEEARMVTADGQLYKHGKKITHHQTLKMMKLDRELMSSLFISSHYYHLLKKGKAATKNFSVVSLEDIESESFSSNVSRKTSSH